MKQTISILLLLLVVVALSTGLDSSQCRPCLWNEGVCVNGPGIVSPASISFTASGSTLEFFPGVFGVYTRITTGAPLYIYILVSHQLQPDNDDDGGDSEAAPNFFYTEYYDDHEECYSIIREG